MIKTVSFSQLRCDGCGVEYKELATGATSVRLKAVMEGWKFCEFNTRPDGQRTRRSYDACPACQLPEDPAQIRDLFEAARRQGRLHQTEPPGSDDGLSA